MNSEFLEKIIIKGLLEDKQFLILVSQVFEKEYFDDPTIGDVFQVSKEYVDKYKKIPPKDVIINSVENSNDIKELFNEINNVDFDIIKNYDYLLEETNKRLKEQAVKRAIIESVDIIDKGEDKSQIRKKVEDALCKDLKIDLGLQYFKDMGPRLKRIFNDTDIRIPTYFPAFDEMIQGGFPPLSLSIIASKIHGMKSSTIANFAARQVLHGHNVVLMTLEMSESAFAQRIDSILSSIDINRMYMSGTYQNRLVKRLSSVKQENPERGELFIKEFPTGAASVNDLRIYLRELIIRGVEPSIMYVDYINLMISSFKTDGSLYSTVKKIGEELRALSFEFKVPVVSVTQLNREGMFTDLAELDFRFLSESIGTGATADFLAIYGLDEDNDNLIYDQTLHGKIVKNRFGMLDIFTFLYDSRTLKLYDSTEMDMWISDAQITGDEREIFNRNKNKKKTYKKEEPKKSKREKATGLGPNEKY